MTTSTQQQDDVVGRWIMFLLKGAIIGVFFYYIYKSFIKFHEYLSPWSDKNWIPDHEGKNHRWKLVQDTEGFWLNFALWGWPLWIFFVANTALAMDILAGPFHTGKFIDTLNSPWAAIIGTVVTFAYIALIQLCVKTMFSSYVLKNPDIFAPWSEKEIRYAGFKNRYQFLAYRDGERTWKNTVYSKEQYDRLMKLVPARAFKHGGRPQVRTLHYAFLKYAMLSWGFISQEKWDRMHEREVARMLAPLSEEDRSRYLVSASLEADMVKIRADIAAEDALKYGYKDDPERQKRKKILEDIRKYRKQGVYLG